MNYMFYLLEAILAVNLLVVVHEFGHMIAGKLFRVPSLKFSIGLGPKLYSVKYKGTEYCVAPVPLGGYVQLDSGHKHSGKTACMDCISPWKRMMIYFCGPAANLILVLVLFWIAFSVIGYKDNKPVFSAVDSGSPAAIAGFKPGERILEIDGKRILTWSQVVLAFQHEGKENLSVVLDRPGHNGEGAFGDHGATIEVVTVTARDLVGTHPSESMVRLRLGPVQAMEKSVEKFWAISKLLFSSVTGLVTHRVSPSELVGPVYLFHVSAKAAAMSQASLVYLLAMISACLFFFNLLPLPILDGGQICLTFLQKLLKRPLAPQSMRLLTHASIVWLFLLLASAMLNDIVRLIHA